MAGNMSQRFSLDGKTAFVTGASRGIGRVLALALADAGADLVVTARTMQELESLCAEVRERGQHAVPFFMDMRDLDSIEAAVKSSAERVRTIDILLNNAGISRRYVALEMTEHEWDQIMDTNVKGLFFCTQAVGRIMAQRGRGKVINVVSTLGLVGSPGIVVYSASKAAVIHLTRALAVEWAEHNITVNAIAPTTTRTEMSAARLSDPEIYERYIRDIPFRRVGTPDDLIGATLFLASPASDFVTGQTLVVDGGFSISKGL